RAHVGHADTRCRVADAPGLGDVTEQLCLAGAKRDLAAEEDPQSGLQFRLFWSLPLTRLYHLQICPFVMDFYQPVSIEARKLTCLFQSHIGRIDGAPVSPSLPSSPRCIW